MAQPELPSHIRFDRFDLDLRTRELRKDGRPVRLQDQPARLLALLVSRAGELLTRSEIEKTLWGADEFVEFEHAINTAMRKIREALGDDLEKPRFIETLPRKGYRFIAPIETYLASCPAPHPQADSVLPAVTELPKANPRESSPPSALSAAPPFALAGSLARRLFLTIQLGYLAMYGATLYKAEKVEDVLAFVLARPSALSLPVVLVLAMCGIAIRMYLLTSVGLNHPEAGEKYRRLFPVLFLFDTIWAMSPLLLIRQLGLGLALGSIAALAYLPFAQHTLMRSVYPGTQRDNRSWLRF